MSDAPRSLPRRPSLEQLRKQAKELARTTDVALHRRDTHSLGNTASRAGRSSFATSKP